MLLPVLDVKLEKYHLETTVARISVLSLMNTISSLRVIVEFSRRNLSVTSSRKPPIEFVLWMRQVMPSVTKISMWLTAASRKPINVFSGCSLC